MKSSVEIWHTRFSKFSTLIGAIFAEFGIPITNDHKKIRTLENIHKDKIGILIGNGPSVRLADLEALPSDCITFCCNRFYLAYPDTRFRPTYTCASDKQTIADFGQEIVANSEGTCFIASPRHPRLKGQYIWIQHFGRKFSYSPYRGINPGGATLVCALQLGFFMGIRKFYLYGVDHNYQVMQKVPSTDVFYSAVGEGNHFIKNYRSGKPWCPPASDYIERSFIECDAILRKNAGGLYNATRGGLLNVLERVSFENIKF